MKLLHLISLLFLANICYAQQFPYKNSQLPIEERVTDLLSRMTLDEKMAQIRHIHSADIFNGQELDNESLQNFCHGIGWGFVEGFTLTSENCDRNFYLIQKYMIERTRLGIPIFTVGESLHGVVQENNTIFPQNIALGSTFNPQLAYRQATIISNELHSVRINQVFAPCIDVVRDLRWGRVEESFGEDPMLCGIMAIAEVNAYLEHGISPMIKHFGAHGNPVGGLNLAAVECGIRDLHDIYLKPFEMVVQHTGILAVMSSYNSWNRIPNSANRYLLTELLRNRWGFKGYVYSDWGAIDMLRTFHFTARNKEEAAMQSLDAGLDAEASSDDFPALIPLIENGELLPNYLDKAVSRVLYAKFKLGLFEDPYGLKFETKKTKRNSESKALSKQIADESTVLIKNDNLLPLNIDKLKSIAVLGPNANQVQFGDYTWSRSNSDGISPLAGIKTLVGNKIKINYAPGCSIASLSKTDIAAAVTAASVSDVALVFVGSSSSAFVRNSKLPITMGEGFDLSSIELTGAQEELIQAIYATGKPVVVVLVSGKPFAIPWVKEHIPAIIAQWYAGEQEGASIADILFGNVNPSGKLTFSFPQSTGHLPCYYNYLPSDRGYYKNPGSYEKPGRDYVFSSPDALWSFGHGLSYTTFEISNVTTDKQKYNENDTIFIAAKVTNRGSRDGKEVVQVYIRNIASTFITPVMQLKAFQKINIKKGEKVFCQLSIPISELFLTNDNGYHFFEPGEFEIMVGNSSDNISNKIKIEVGNTNKRNKQAEILKPKTRTEFLDGKTITISGVVRDTQGVPVPNASIQIQSDLKQEVNTSDDGGFIIIANENDQLIFSKKGFFTVIQEVSGHKVINVQLHYGDTSR